MASHFVVDARAGERVVGKKSCRMFGDFPELVRGSTRRRHRSQLDEWLLSSLDVLGC